MSRKWSLVIGKQRVTLEITRAIRRKPKAKVESTGGIGTWMPSPPTDPRPQKPAPPVMKQP